MKFGKIIKLVAARCEILRLKCTIVDFGWSSAPDPLGVLRAFPDPVDGIKRTYF